METPENRDRDGAVNSQQGGTRRSGGHGGQKDGGKPGRVEYEE